VGKSTLDSNDSSHHKFTNDRNTFESQKRCDPEQQENIKMGLKELD
jgi:hypothetical protein